MAGRSVQPLRTCVGCGRKRPKSELLRVVRQPDGAVCGDPTGHAPGRGGYVCWNEVCVERARKRGSLARTLKTGLAAEVWIALLRVVQQGSSNEARCD